MPPTNSLTDTTLPDEDAQAKTPGIESLWSLRLLLEGNQWRTVLGGRRFGSDEILDLIGLEKEFEALADDDDIFPLLHGHALKLEEQQPRFAPRLGRNLQALTRVFKLSALEQSVLAFMVYRDSSQAFAEVINPRSKASHYQIQRAMSVALATPYRHIRRALSPSGVLFQAGLIGPSVFDADVLELDDGLTDLLLFDDEVVQALLQRYSSPAPSALVQWNDFDYLATQRDLMHDYLQQACQQQLGGVNVLLYGEPGTGKTQLVRLLADSLGAKLQEIRCNDRDELPVSASKRFAAYRYCQRMLKDQANTLILFDEIEDVFGFGASRGQKAWVNQLLEENPLPAFWLTNSIECLEDAFIRRFDLVIQMPSLDGPQREHLARQFFQGLPLPAPWLEQLKLQDGIQAGHLQQAARVAEALGDAGEMANAKRLESILTGTLQAQGKPWREALPVRHARFDPQLANADTDLDKLTTSVSRHGEARICLYGPSGSGKSEFARYLAAELNKPLLSVAGSDLLQPWLGLTEQAIAAAFTDARQRDAVLLFDEAESWLMVRRLSGPQWQVNQVNEFLQQLENYTGIVILTTNHLYAMDPAVLRRLDMKVAFDYMQPRQAWQLFCRLVDSQEQGEALSLQASLGNLRLTAGDFACVERRMRLLDKGCNAFNLLAALKEEHRLRVQLNADRLGEEL